MLRDRRGARRAGGGTGAGSRVRAGSARAHRRDRGQSLAEAALAIPMLVILVMGVADGGRAFSYRENVTNAARQALRVAVSPDEENGQGKHPGRSACQKAGATFTGQASGYAHLPAQSGDDAFMANIARAAWLESSTDGTTSGSKLYNSGTPTTVKATWDCLTGNVIANRTTGAVSDPSSTTSAAITVTVTYQFTILTPLAAKVFPNTVISTTVTQRAEY